MLVVTCVLAGAVVAGWAAGGRLRNLGQVHLRLVWLVFTAVGLQLALAAVSFTGGPVQDWSRLLLTGSHVALVGFVWANRALPGMLLVVCGFGLNAAVIVVNGAMPVAREALVAAGGAGHVHPGKHRLLEPGDHLATLADVIPVPPLSTVASLGDLVLAAGVTVLVFNLMRRTPRPHGSRVRPAPRPLWRRRAGAP